MARLHYNAEFEYGEMVYMIHDPEQEKRQITGHLVRGNEISYELSCGEKETWCKEIEISREKNILL